MILFVCLAVAQYLHSVIHIIIVFLLYVKFYVVSAWKAQEINFCILLLVMTLNQPMTCTRCFQQHVTSLVSCTFVFSNVDYLD